MENQHQQPENVPNEDGLAALISNEVSTQPAGSSQQLLDENKIAAFVCRHFSFRNKFSVPLLMFTHQRLGTAEQKAKFKILYFVVEEPAEHYKICALKVRLGTSRDDFKNTVRTYIEMILKKLDRLIEERSRKSAPSRPLMLRCKEYFKDQLDSRIGETGMDGVKPVVYEELITRESTLRVHYEVMTGLWYMINDVLDEPEAIENYQWILVRKVKTNNLRSITLGGKFHARNVEYDLRLLFQMEPARPMPPPRCRISASEPMKKRQKLE